MDNEREVYDAFSLLYDRAKKAEDGHRYVSMVDLFNTSDLLQKDVLEVIDKWIASDFLALEDGGQQARATGNLRITSDGKTFFKAKYRL